MALARITRRKAAEETYRECECKLENWIEVTAARIGMHRDEIASIAHDAFLKTYQNFDPKHKSRCAFTSLLATNFRNAIRSLLENRRWQQKRMTNVDLAAMAAPKGTREWSKLCEELSEDVLLLATVAIAQPLNSQVPKRIIGGCLAYCQAAIQQKLAEACWSEARYKEAVHGLVEAIS